MILKTGPAPYWMFDSGFGESGAQFHSRYVTAKPFPHIVLDDFLAEELAELCLLEFPQTRVSKVQYSRNQENKKLEYKPEALSPFLRMLFYSFNSGPFIKFLETLTGIKGLIPDPYFSGAGMHEVANGGHLNIHADFNHHSQMGLEAGSMSLSILIGTGRRNTVDASRFGTAP
jgi:hypothetical protein